MELFVALLKSLQKYFFIDQLKSKSSITIQGEQLILGQKIPHLKHILALSTYGQKPTILMLQSFKIVVASK